MMKVKTLCVAVFALGMAGSAVAADGAALYASKGCLACHGPDANTPVMPAYPKLAGQNAQ